MKKKQKNIFLLYILVHPRESSTRVDIEIISMSWKKIWLTINYRVLLVPTNKLALWLMLLAFLESCTRIGSGDAAQSLSKWSETVYRRNLDWKANSCIVTESLAKTKKKAKLLLVIMDSKIGRGNTAQSLSKWSETMYRRNLDWKAN